MQLLIATIINKKETSLFYLNFENYFKVIMSKLTVMTTQ